MPRAIFRKGQLISIHSWGEEEDEILRREYRHTKSSLVALHNRLKLGKEVIRQRLIRIGILKKGKIWTPYEDEQLRAEYGNIPTSVIAKKHQRTESAVTRRAYNLGLSKYEREGWYTMEEVCQFFGVSPTWIKRRMNDGHHLDVVPFDPEKIPKKNSSSPYYISRESLREFLRRCPGELNGKDVDMVVVVDILAGIKVETYEQCEE